MDIKSAVRDVLGVKEQPGEEWVTTCFSPEHADSHPSASVNVSKGVWFCYSCGRGGKVADLLDGTPISEPDPDEEALSLLRRMQTDTTPTPYPESYLELFVGRMRGEQYWAGRGLSLATVTKFKLGWDPTTERPCYPLRSPRGELLGVVYRNLDGMPKYVYPPGSRVSDLLFGYDQLSPTKPVVVAEGAVDALAAWDVGFQAVCIFGSHLSELQRSLLVRLNPPMVTLAFDMDASGSVATVNALRMLEPMLSVTVASWSPVLGKDLAELSANQRREVLTRATTV